MLVSMRWLPPLHPRSRMCSREKWKPPLSQLRTSHAPAKTTANDARTAENGAYFLRRRIRGDIIIFRLQSKKQVTCGATDDESGISASCRPDVTFSAQELMWSRIMPCCSRGMICSSAEEERVEGTGADELRLKTRRSSLRIITKSGSL